jgi:hypothetical protein
MRVTERRLQGEIDMSIVNPLIDSISGLQAQISHRWPQRDFIKGIAALAGTAALSAYDPRSAGAEPPPEVAKIGLTNTPASCLAPQHCRRINSRCHWCAMQYSVLVAIACVAVGTSASP